MSSAPSGWNNLQKTLKLQGLITISDFLITDFYLQMMECVNVLLCSILASLDWCYFILLVCIVCVLLFIDLFYCFFCLTQCNCVCVLFAAFQALLVKDFFYLKELAW